MKTTRKQKQQTAVLVAPGADITPQPQRAHTKTNNKQKRVQATGQVDAKKKKKQQKKKKNTRKEKNKTQNINTSSRINLISN